MKFIFSTLLLCLTFFGSSLSTNIDCKYEYWNFNVLDSTYHCDATEDHEITSQESAEITSIHGTHKNSKVDTDVVGFYANGRVMEYFPRGLEIFFVNLKVIFIASSKLQEIHQSDLEKYVDLIYLCLRFNKIEVIEEGLFEFNPKLETLIFYESNVIHIDPDVFDNLPNLVNFWFKEVKCIGHDVRDYRTGVEEAIDGAKKDCVDSKFIKLSEELKGLEADLTEGNFEDFNIKLENFENSFNNSKFVKFRPLNYKFAAFKSDFYLNYQELFEDSNPTTTSAPKPQYTIDISEKFEDLKSSQCGMSSFLSDIKISQENLKKSFTDIKNSQNDQKGTLSGIATSIEQYCVKNATIDNMDLTTALTNLTLYDNSALNDIKVTQESIKSSQDVLKSSIDAVKSSQDNMQSSMSDMEVTLSDIKKNQNEYKENIIKMKNSQNEIRISLNNISPEKDNEKLAKLEEKLDDLMAESVDRFDKIEKELLNTRHKLSSKFDEKVKEIEKNLVKKFEEIFEEKLGKIVKK